MTKKTLIWVPICKEKRIKKIEVKVTFVTWFCFREDVDMEDIMNFPVQW